MVVVPSPSEPPSPFRFVTLTVILVLQDLSYFPGLLHGGQDLNKIKFPLASYRLDLIKYSTDKG